MRWVRNHIGRHPAGTHTFVLVEVQQAYTGRKSYFIKCLATQKSFFGLGPKKEVVGSLQYHLFDSGGGSWYTQEYENLDKAEKDLEALRVGIPLQARELVCVAASSGNTSRKIEWERLMEENKRKIFEEIQRGNHEPKC